MQPSKDNQRTDTYFKRNSYSWSQNSKYSVRLSFLLELFSDVKNKSIQRLSMFRSRNSKKEWRAWLGPQYGLYDMDNQQRTHLHFFQSVRSWRVIFGNHSVGTVSTAWNTITPRHGTIFKFIFNSFEYNASCVATIT